jgi:hypothetical protein
VRGVPSLSGGKARDAITRYLQHLDDHLVEQAMQTGAGEAMASPPVPRRQPNFVPATGNERTQSFVLFVPPADPLDLKGAKVQKYFRENPDRGTAGRTYLGEVEGYDHERLQWQEELLLTSNLTFSAAHSSTTFQERSLIACGC